jgi:hypothetical protein
MKEYGNHGAAAVDFDVGRIKIGEEFTVLGEIHVFEKISVTHCSQCGQKLRQPEFKLRMVEGKSQMV